MAISSVRDNNRDPAILATLNTDGVTVMALMADPVTHRLKASDGTTGSSFAFVDSQRDANRIPAVWAVSSADGATPIPIYATSTGQLLTKST